ILYNGSNKKKKETKQKTSIKTITYLSDTGCLEIQGASLATSPLTLSNNVAQDTVTLFKPSAG
ncbi:hypothetical protein ABUU02_11250, partial [Escherichia coli]|uniref:hypothetical protein n=1 Tax=Escherichia coli TaxID=562 RepID=UPI003355DE77